MWHVAPYRYAWLMGAAALLSLAAGPASAQTTPHPDGADCAQLSGGARVACQNRIYEGQLQSGVSRDETPDQQTVSPSARIGIGTGVPPSELGKVVGAEGSALPDPEGTARPTNP